jgi:threonylcarbamoyladenosine tRNA methylthiotransferase MtaB
VRSRGLESIKAEAERLAAKGYKEIVLVGINLSAFGQDTGLTLCDAVGCIAEVDGIERIRLGSLECDFMSDLTLEMLSKCEKFCPQFHLSLQSGCDKTLKDMNRKYDTAFFADMVNRIRKNFNNPSITTDIMVGFAGESDEDFESTCEFVESIGFARAHVFVYSEREGTVAAKRECRVPADVRQQRAKVMAEICQNSEQEFLKSQIGLTSNVLFETREGEFWTGYTENYTRVFVKDENIAEGDVLRVQLTECCGDHLIGKI